MFKGSRKKCSYFKKYFGPRFWLNSQVSKRMLNFLNVSNCNKYYLRYYMKLVKTSWTDSKKRMSWILWTFWTHSTYSSLLSHVLWTAIVLNSMGIIGHLSVLTSLLAKRFKRNIYLSYHWPRQYQTITFVLMKLLLCEHRHITLNFASQASPPPKKILIEWMNSEKTTNRIITLLHYSNY